MISRSSESRLRWWSGLSQDQRDAYLLQQQREDKHFFAVLAVFLLLGLCVIVAMCVFE